MPRLDELVQTELYRSGEVTLGPGQTKEILHGDPEETGGYIQDEELWTVFVRPTFPGTVPPNSVSLIGTRVAEDPAPGVMRLWYTIRNNDPANTVTFRRMSVRVRKRPPL